MPGLFDYREIDISKDPSSMMKYGVQASPTIIILDSTGMVSDTFTGVPAKTELKAAIEKAS